MSFTVEVGPDQELNIEIVSGLNENVQPFCQVMLNGTLAGQLPPSEIRGMALQWLEAAEAAESDAIVAAEMIETIGLDLPTAASFIAGLRKRRKW